MGVLQFAEDDPAMAFAIAEAQRTLAEFFRQHASPAPDQQFFLVKVKFAVAGEVEHIWVADLDDSREPIAGTVANEPKILSLVFMQRVHFLREQVTDWMIIQDGYMVGGYTNQVAIERMSHAEREAHLAALPYKVRGSSGAA